MSLTNLDSQTRKIIHTNLSDLTLSAIVAIPVFKELLKEAFRFECLIKRAYSFKLNETELKITFAEDKTAFLSCDGILRIPVEDGEYTPIHCKVDHIFDFLRKMNFSEASTDIEKEKNIAALENFESFMFHTQEVYMSKKNQH